MPLVPTVLGPVDADDLGPTLMHEHLFVLSPEYVRDYGAGTWWDEDERVADAAAKLRAVRDLGIRTVVDQTVQGIGRDIRLIRRVAELVPDLHIVVATGLYTFNALPQHYAFRGPGGLIDMPDPMIGDFTRDLVEGIADTGIRAALLKFCVEADGLTPGVERVAVAVARVHRETGAPISVHTDSGSRSGLLALEVLGRESVDPARVLIGHAGDSTDLDYLTRLADTGATLGMDRFGLALFGGLEERVETVAALAARGYADRMVLSHDAHCFPDYLAPDPDAIKARALPDWHFGHIGERVLPMLRERGVDEKDIQRMLVDNPRRFLGA
ncbi:phosphotriesterase [Streptomyces radicis]|uniref:Phosphotriesterase n=1 Tax=Streptomyces radicis TaxID=1750517 RepID=A0A3A9WJ73_9ACTN|nr:phosphotriesterase [Streptomyces radicis]RKN12870.1 phosphotriesterase [Streptomyces radicis]RKN27365.1 phosphotriesterase [Streptomyces radicis]